MGRKVTSISALSLNRMLDFSLVFGGVDASTFREVFVETFDAFNRANTHSIVFTSLSGTAVSWFYDYLRFHRLFVCLSVCTPVTTYCTCTITSFQLSSWSLQPCSQTSLLSRVQVWTQERDGILSTVKRHARQAVALASPCPCPSECKEAKCSPLAIGNDASWLLDVLMSDLSWWLFQCFHDSHGCSSSGFTNIHSLLGAFFLSAYCPHTIKRA